MDVISSPQPADVGEAVNSFTSYASKLSGQPAAESKSQLQLCPITIDQGVPTVEFTVDEINSFTKEEGLHQAVIFKLSYGKPDLQELWQILPKQLAVKGICIIGQLEYRHILVRFDLFEDFAQVVSRTNGYLRVKGEEFFYRTFPWTMGFNPRKETSKAVVWISLPELPANLFAQKSILSIASSVGKPIAVEKATKDRSRPSTARVKVLINLLDKHPSTIKIKIVDSKSGKVSTFDQKIVIDNAPAYCTHCCHQGHNVKSCRRIQDNETIDSITTVSRNTVDKLKGDARDFLNQKRASQRRVEHKNPIVSTDQHPKPVWKQKTLPINAIEPVQLSNTTDKPIQQCGRGNEGSSIILLQQFNNLESSNPIGSESLPSLKETDEAKTDALRNNEHLTDRGNKTVLTDVPTTACSKIRNATERGKKSMTSVSLKPISKTEFEASIANSSYAIGSVSGTKYDRAQQIPSDLTGQVFSCKANTLNGHNSDNIPSAFGSFCLPNHNDWNKSQLQVANLDDQSRRYFPVAEFLPEPIRDLAHFNKSSTTVPLKVLAANEDSAVCRHPAARDSQQIITEDMQHSSKAKKDTQAEGNFEFAEKAYCSADKSNSKSTVSSSLKMDSPQEISKCHIKARSDDGCTGKTGQIVCFTSHLGSTKEQHQGQCTSNEGRQYTTNAQQQQVDLSPRNSRSESSQTKNTQFSKKTSEITTNSNPLVALAEIDNHDDKMMGGMIKKVQSYTPLSISSAYSGEYLNDNEEFSSLEGKNKQLIVANMKDMVIKSKLWDQQHYDDDESLEEGSGRWSSAEEDSDDTINSAVKKKNADLTGSKLNHNAQIFIPKKASTADPLKTNQSTLAAEIIIHAGKRQGQYESSVIQISSEKRHIQNAMEIFEEGEEEEMLRQCLKDAARKGDLSPMHSKTNKKSRQRDRSWDGRVTQEASIRRPPMRVAKLKQLAQRTKA